MSNLKEFIKIHEDKLNGVKVKLGSAINANKQYLKLQQDYKKVQEARDTYADLRRKLSIYKDSTNKEDNEFKARRLSFLSNYITKNLEVVVPQEELTAKVDPKYKYRSSKATLQLYDNNGNTYKPIVQQGGLVQQLISFSAAASLVECLGYKFLILDEPFSESSRENLIRVSNLISKLVNNDFQIFLIEHKDDVYKDLPRREIRIIKDEVSKSARVVSIEDY